MIPGKKPASATPRWIAQRQKPSGPRTNIMQDVTTPQLTRMRQIHFRALSFSG